MNQQELADEQVYKRGYNTGFEAGALHAKQQADRIAELEKENANLKYEISSGAWQPKEATDQELFNIYAHLQDTYEGNNFPVELGRKILKLYTHPVKQLSDEEIIKVCKLEGFAGDLSLLISFARAIIKEIAE